MLRFVAPISIAVGLLATSPTRAAASSPDGAHDDTTYAADASFTSAPDAGAIVTSDVVYRGARTAFLTGLTLGNDSAPQVASHDDTTYPTATPASAPQRAAPVQLACDCVARR